MGRKSFGFGAHVRFLAFGWFAKWRVKFARAAKLQIYEPFVCLHYATNRARKRAHKWPGKNKGRAPDCVARK